jgi:hypothetical protein
LNFLQRSTGALKTGKKRLRNILRNKFKIVFWAITRMIWKKNFATLFNFAAIRIIILGKKQSEKMIWNFADLNLMEHLSRKIIPSRVISLHHFSTFKCTYSPVILKKKNNHRSALVAGVDSVASIRTMVQDKINCRYNWWRKTKRIVTFCKWPMRLINLWLHGSGHKIVVAFCVAARQILFCICLTLV